MRTFTQKWAFLLMALLCLVVSPQVVFADDDCLVIGNGTATSSWHLPISTYYHNSYSQQLFLADEITDGAGQITEIAFQYNTATSTARTISIYMANTSVADLSKADCDTIARTHLVKYMYTTADLVADRVPTQNMMHRYIATEAGFDNDSNAVVVLEGQAKINFYLKDDSVENGIMQPIDKVIEKSNKYISDLISKNPRISTFYLALIKTGVIADVQEGL